MTKAIIFDCFGVLCDGNLDKNTELLELIRKLKTSDYKIGMISNMSNNWVREAFLDSEEQSLFDDMVFSYEVGLNKPNPEIYELSCERLGVRPSDTIFVDDSEVNCQGAEKTGMKTIHYRNFATFVEELSSLTGTSTGAKVDN